MPRFDDLLISEGLAWERAGRPTVNIERENGGVALAVGVIGALCLGVVLIPLREITHAANFAFVFMALTIAVAEWGGRGAAVATAFASALSLDFFLTRPYLQLAMAEKDDVITFVGLTLCGLVAAAFGDRADRRTAAMRHRQLLHSATRLLEEGGPPGAAFAQALEAARSILPVAALSVRDAHGVLVGGTGAAAGRAGVERMLRADTLVGDWEPEHKSWFAGRPLPMEGGRLPLQAGNRIVGFLDVWGDGQVAGQAERQVLTDFARALGARLALGSSALTLS
jgi:K+-sensing histidine kinase KdpD